MCVVCGGYEPALIQRMSPRNKMRGNGWCSASRRRGAGMDHVARGREPAISLPPSAGARIQIPIQPTLPASCRLFPCPPLRCPVLFAMAAASPSRRRCAAAEPCASGRRRRPQSRGPPEPRLLWTRFPLPATRSAAPAGPTHTTR